MNKVVKKEGLIELLGVLLFIFTFAIDQYTKALALKLVEPVIVFKGFASLVFKLSKNAVFSFSLPAPSWIIFAVTIPLFIALVVVWGISLYKKESFSFWIAIVLGGGAGNLFDRINHGGVVDWIEFSLGTFHWSSFNFADAFIIIGALGWLIHSSRVKQQKIT